MFGIGVFVVEDVIEMSWLVIVCFILFVVILFIVLYGYEVGI